MAEAAGIGHVVSRISEGKQGSKTYLRVDVWDDTTLRDDDVAQELVQPIARSVRAEGGKRKAVGAYSSSFRMASCR